MMRMWLPGPKPWGGTTKRALLSIICVPPTSGVDVLMIIFCWTVPVAEVENGVFAGPATGMFFWILRRASCEEGEEGVLSPLSLPLWLFEIFCALVGVGDVCARLLCMVEDNRATHWLDCMFVDVSRPFLVVVVGVTVVNGDVEEQSPGIGLKEDVHCCFELVVRWTLEADWTVMLFELVLSLNDVALVCPVSQTDFWELTGEVRGRVSMVCPRVAVLPGTWN